MIERTLSNGAHIRVRPVPPHVVLQFHRAVGQKMPPEPEKPTRRVTMADGHVETDVITEGPEFDAYQVSLDEWERKCDEMIATANDEYNDLQRDYSIVEWSWDGEHWRRAVPDDWERPAALDRAGIAPCSNRRVEYIGVELLTTTEDWAIVRAVADGTANVTDEEAGRVRAGFRPGDRRSGDAVAARVGWLRRLALTVSRRDGGGQGVGADA